MLARRIYVSLHAMRYDRRGNCSKAKRELIGKATRGSIFRATKKTTIVPLPARARESGVFGIFHRDALEERTSFRVTSNACFSSTRFQDRAFTYDTRDASYSGTLQYFFGGRAHYPNQPRVLNSSLSFKVIRCRPITETMPVYPPTQSRIEQHVSFSDACLWALA